MIEKWKIQVENESTSNLYDDFEKFVLKNASIYLTAKLRRLNELTDSKVNRMRN